MSPNSVERSRVSLALLQLSNMAHETDNASNLASPHLLHRSRSVSPKLQAQAAHAHAAQAQAHSEAHHFGGNASHHHYSAYLHNGAPGSGGSGNSFAVNNSSNNNNNNTGGGSNSGSGNRPPVTMGGSAPSGGAGAGFVRPAPLPRPEDENNPLFGRQVLSNAASAGNHHSSTNPHHTHISPHHYVQQRFGLGPSPTGFAGSGSGGRHAEVDDKIKMASYLLLLRKFSPRTPADSPRSPSNGAVPPGASRPHTFSFGGTISPREPFVAGPAAAAASEGQAGRTSTNTSNAKASRKQGTSRKKTKGSGGATQRKSSKKASAVAALKSHSNTSSPRKRKAQRDGGFFSGAQGLAGTDSVGTVRASGNGSEEKLLRRDGGRPLPKSPRRSLKKGQAQRSGGGRKRGPGSTGSSDDETTKCNCKNSSCLKMYCECFAKQVFCQGDCRCQNCFNTFHYKKERDAATKAILKARPDAFEGKTVCSCKRSNCQKGYCKCYGAGVGCGPSCTCINCHNENGRAGQSQSAGPASGNASVISAGGKKAKNSGPSVVRATGVPISVSVRRTARSGPLGTTDAKNKSGNRLRRGVPSAAVDADGANSGSNSFRSDSRPTAVI